MRIVDSTQLGNTAPTQTGRTGALQTIDSAGKDAAVIRKGFSASDSVHLSGFADRLSQTVQAAAVSRAQRMSDLTAAVRSGTYQVDAKAISHSMVSQSVSSGGSRNL